MRVMAELAPTPVKVPTVLTCKVNDLDKPVVAELMQLTGITDSTQLIRYCLRSALREFGVNGAGSNKKQHRPIAAKG